MNNAVMIGRLGKDPELTYTATGTAICKFSLAVDRQKGGDGEKVTDWFDVVAWGRQAETSAQYLHKGSRCAVQGSVEIQTWEKKDCSCKGYRVEINARNVSFLDSKEERSAAPAPVAQAQAAAPAQTSAAAAFGDDDDQDPFGDQ